MREPALLCNVVQGGVKASRLAADSEGLVLAISTTDQAVQHRRAGSISQTAVATGGSIVSQAGRDSYVGTQSAPPAPVNSLVRVLIMAPEGSEIKYA